MEYILITGGFGFIGSHTICELKDYNIIVIDNFSNSNEDIVLKIEKIIQKKIKYFKFDINNYTKLKEVFNNYNIKSVIHFAAFKSVSESITNPIKYYKNNINGLINLLNIMEQYNCHELIFSSSATVYGKSKSPLNEESYIGNGITNPYGNSKYIAEIILKDFSKIKNNKIISLRYFNPIGCHQSGLIGEKSSGIPSNIMPYLLNVSLQNNNNKFLNENYNYLKIFGNNYNTKDGTCIRDYIHVVDLANAHLKALESLKDGYNYYNIGTGKGTSVLELINTFENVNNIKIPYEIVEKRKGDIDQVYCSINKANIELKWYPKYNIEDMCKDSWNFIINN